jgi:hypothetical protein
MCAVGDMVEHETVFRAAVSRWWSSEPRGTMSGFRDAIRDKLLRIGVSEDDIFFDAELPSSMQGSRAWDIIVCKNSFLRRLRCGARAPDDAPFLLAAIGLHSLPTAATDYPYQLIGESMVSAAGFWGAWRSYPKWTDQVQPQPLLGHVIVGLHEPRHMHVRHEEQTRATRRWEFLEWMYGQRYFDFGCVMTTCERIRDCDHNYVCPLAWQSDERFLHRLTVQMQCWYS